MALNVAGGTMTGGLITAASTTARAGLNIPPGVAPTSPVNGDTWTTSAGMFVRAGGTTYGPIGPATSLTGLARSVIGVTGNVGAVVASIQGSTDQVLRVNGAGDALAFGAIDLSKSATVGSSILARGNGGFGIDVSASTGLPLFAAGTPTFTATTGTGNIARMSGLPLPTTSGAIATKEYVDTVAGGITPLPLSRLATATGVVLPNSPTYSNGASGVGATLTASSNTTLTVDSVVAALNDIILVKDQAAPAQNGQFYVSAAGSGAAPWVLTRCSVAGCGAEYDSAATMTIGSNTRITAGSTNVGTSWVQSTTITTVGTDPVVYIAGGASVVSFNARSGVVVPATADYAVGQVTGAAPLASPALTGNPTAPTPAVGDNDTSIPTTAFVATAIANGTPTSYVVFPDGSTCKNDGTVDCTTVIQAQITACNAALGGRVMMPAGKFLVNNGLVVSGGSCEFEGNNWQDYAGSFGSGTVGTTGTYLLQTTTANSIFKIANTANHFTIRNIAIYQTQPADAPGWTPTAYPPVIVQSSPSVDGAGSIFVDNVMLWGVTAGIQIGNTDACTGRTTLNNVWGKVYNTAIWINCSGDVVRITNSHIYTGFISGMPNADAYIKANGIAFRLSRADNPVFSNIFSYGYKYGLRIDSMSFLGTTYTSQLVQVSNCGFDNSGVSGVSVDGGAVSVGAIGASIQIANCYVSGSGGPAFDFQPITGRAQMTNIRVQDAQYEAINVAGAGARVDAVNVSVANPVVAFTASISGTNMTVSAVASGTLRPGMAISGTGVVSGSTGIVSQSSGTTGGAGVYVINQILTIGSEGMTAEWPAFVAATDTILAMKNVQTTPTSTLQALSSGAGRIEGVWRAWDFVINGGTSFAATNVSSSYIISDALMTAVAAFDVTTAGTGQPYVNISQTPFRPVRDCPVTGFNAGTSYTLGGILSGGDNQVYVFQYDGAYPARTGQRMRVQLSCALSQ